MKKLSKEAEIIEHAWLKDWKYHDEEIFRLKSSIEVEKQQVRDFYE